MAEPRELISILSALLDEQLVPVSIEIDLDGRPLRVLGLETIVALKRRSTAAKDQLMLAVLEETLGRSKG